MLADRLILKGAQIDLQKPMNIKAAKKKLLYKTHLKQQQFYVALVTQRE